MGCKIGHPNSKKLYGQVEQERKLHDRKPTPGTRKNIPLIERLLQHRVTIHDSNQEGFPGAIHLFTVLYKVLEEVGFHLIPQAQTFWVAYGEVRLARPPTG